MCQRLCVCVSDTNARHLRGHFRGSLFCFLPLNLPVFPLESSGWCIQSLSSLLGVVLGVVLLDQRAKNLSLQNFGSTLWCHVREDPTYILGHKTYRSPKTDPMLVSVDPVEHRRKMYYVVKKNFSGQYGEVFDNSLLPLWEFLWFVVLGDLLGVVLGFVCLINNLETLY